MPSSRYQTFNVCQESASYGNGNYGNHPLVTQMDHNMELNNTIYYSTTLITFQAGENFYW